MKEKSIELLVNEHYFFAKVFDYFGVEFDKSRKQTLEEVCKLHHIDCDKMINILETSKSRKSPEYLDLRNYPARLIIEYLKHAHQIFIKDTLPYLLKLIEGLSDDDNQMVKDLKLIMPMFVEDFIHHIYEEEDRLFAFVYDLEMLIATKSISTQAISKMNNFSVQEFALHHNSSDDEMSGIRGVTNQYNVDGIENMQLQVMMKELMAFDQELTRHANIENDILFPKVLKLEKEALELIKKKSILN